MNFKALFAAACVTTCCIGNDMPAAKASAYDDAYVGGALYGVTCALLTGKATPEVADLALEATLRDRGLPASYAERPAAQKFARLMFVRRGGC